MCHLQPPPLLFIETQGQDSMSTLSQFGKHSALKLCFGDGLGHISFEESKHHTLYQPLTRDSSTLLPAKLFRCRMYARSWGAPGDKRPREAPRG